jgi:hypothetical protein
MEAPKQDEETYVVPADEVTKSNPLLNVLKDPAKAKKLPAPKPADADEAAPST